MRISYYKGIVSILIIGAMTIGHTHAGRQYYIPDNSMLETMEQAADFYISHPRIQNEFDEVINTLTIQPKSGEESDWRNYDYAIVLRRIVQRRNIENTLHSYGPMLSIDYEGRDNYVGQVEFKGTISKVEKQVCNLYGIPYLSKETCETDGGERTSQTLYQFDVTEYTTPQRQYANRIGSKPGDPLIFDLNIFKDTYEISTSGPGLQVQIPHLRPGEIAQFEKYANTGEEVTLSFLRTFIGPTMYFSDMDVMYDVRVSE